MIMKKNNIGRNIIILLYILILSLYIWMQGTHSLKNGCINMPPATFSFSNINPIQTIIIALTYFQLFISWIYYVEKEKKSKIDYFSLFPIGKGRLSKATAILLSTLNIFSTSLSYIFLCAYCLLTKWRILEDEYFMLTAFIGAIIFWSIANFAYGLFNPKVYKNIV